MTLIRGQRHLVQGGELVIGWQHHRQLSEADRPVLQCGTRLG
jgi:hypothetical protein